MLIEEGEIAAAEVLEGELAEEAGLALYGEAEPAAPVELADGTGVVLSAEALLAPQDEGGATAGEELDGTWVVVG